MTSPCSRPDGWRTRSWPGARAYAGYRLFEADGRTQQRKGNLLFSTMHAFKGLERQAVLAIDMAEIGQDHWSMLHYTGLSRARVLLHLFLPTSARGRYDKQARAFGGRMKVAAP